MAEFHSSYGSNISITGIRGAWSIQGPQAMEQLPEVVRHVFEEDEAVQTVIIVYRNGQGSVTQRNSEEEVNNANIQVDEGLGSTDVD
jgi:hypothetical protein